MRIAGELLLEHVGLGGLDALIDHGSDTVRGWAAYVVGLAPGLSLAERLTLVRPLADDPHFGVREWAWMPLRPHIAADVTRAVKIARAVGPRGVARSCGGSPRRRPGRGACWTDT